ncbi:acetyl-CoA decarbonylase/synthase complex subunit delta [Sporobacter termitidis DSM 10068]|uniref:Acetyl-CoA decarbonylase/synthase complex subunit delta n=1 Tax=Sporobacter termitidis DSM 10068 TaxID=1123282 RepID=A0A1M5Z237_9FIRM|nr:acetyl-CoA decarbonylase/synthase complex subunit delta [Sporobacter termitidis]SHI18317.1 acetyl-CoA decarbonylase/synthase complex subunit delta [Sporobacter termitidis DSM 10068]
MPFTAKPRTFNAAINETVLGTGAKAVTLGGQNVLPLYFFDNTPKNAPAVGIEITDTGYDATGLPALAAFYDGAATPAERAKKAASAEGVSFVCLRFEGADPGGLNKSIADCVAVAKDVLNAIDVPLVVAGCKNIEKDAELFSAVAEVCQGKNVLFLSAREEDYKTVGASVGLAYGQKVGAESAVDINLAKQLNVVMTQLGVSAQSIVMNLGAAAAGYGFEYVASTLDRVKAAALEQNDTMLQMPVMTPVSVETWSVKEAIMAEADMPEWGSQEERGIRMETVTASACLASGAESVILRHPASVKTIAAMIAALL